ncbi:uncharacterized protein SPAPADRAFT_66035 [Spathaspora passalidarum NRRL Y-27907]|uniref:Flo11 domain-containing protein n=1 Tax=Spathaspora passalidarum (strain NRRL Y-27907 / 11-Y1) TaxID=619300 RepID=G3AKY0_SPAPN|nr:uncharacterized protein SPAPADRAFT_66035 [Spathaspora passalidarum NRRL Y-27907]EGW33023.1 hypothetical protein SPAPADRAFT_66035 [Spathaspora passalidarum NRRL Y-27907]
MLQIWWIYYFLLQIVVGANSEPTTVYLFPAFSHETEDCAIQWTSMCDPVEVDPSKNTNNPTLEIFEYKYIRQVIGNDDLYEVMLEVKIEDSIDLDYLKQIYFTHRQVPDMENDSLWIFDSMSNILIDSPYHIFVKWVMVAQQHSDQMCTTPFELVYFWQVPRADNPEYTSMVRPNYFHECQDLGGGANYYPLQCWDPVCAEETTTSEPESELTSGIKTFEEENTIVETKETTLVTVVLPRSDMSESATTIDASSTEEVADLPTVTATLLKPIFIELSPPAIECPSSWNNTLEDVPFGGNSRTQGYPELEIFEFVSIKWSHRDFYEGIFEIKIADIYSISELRYIKLDMPYHLGANSVYLWDESNNDWGSPYHFYVSFLFEAQTIDQMKCTNTMEVHYWWPNEYIYYYHGTQGFWHEPDSSILCWDEVCVRPPNESSTEEDIDVPTATLELLESISDLPSPIDCPSSWRNGVCDYPLGSGSIWNKNVKLEIFEFISIKWIQEDYYEAILEFKIDDLYPASYLERIDIYIEDPYNYNTQIRLYNVWEGGSDVDESPYHFYLSYLFEAQTIGQLKCTNLLSIHYYWSLVDHSSYYHGCEESLGEYGSFLDYPLQCWDEVCVRPLESSTEKEWDSTSESGETSDTHKSNESNIVFETSDETDISSEEPSYSNDFAEPLDTNEPYNETSNSENGTNDLDSATVTFDESEGSSTIGIEPVDNNTTVDYSTEPENDTQTVTQTVESMVETTYPSHLSESTEEESFANGETTVTDTDESNNVKETIDIDITSQVKATTQVEATDGAHGDITEIIGETTESYNDDIINSTAAPAEDVPWLESETRDEDNSTDQVTPESSKPIAESSISLPNNDASDPATNESSNPLTKDSHESDSGVLTNSPIEVLTEPVSESQATFLTGETTWFASESPTYQRSSQPPVETNSANTEGTTRSLLETDELNINSTTTIFSDQSVSGTGVPVGLTSEDSKESSLNPAISSKLSTGSGTQIPTSSPSKVLSDVSISNSSKLGSRNPSMLSTGKHTNADPNPNTTDKSEGNSSNSAHGNLVTATITKPDTTYVTTITQPYKLPVIVTTISGPDTTYVTTITGSYKSLDAVTTIGRSDTANVVNKSSNNVVGATIVELDTNYVTTITHPGGFSKVTTGNQQSLVSTTSTSSSHDPAVKVSSLFNAPVAIQFHPSGEQYQQEQYQQEQKIQGTNILTGASATIGSDERTYQTSIQAVSTASNSDSEVVSSIPVAITSSSENTVVASSAPEATEEFEGSAPILRGDIFMVCLYLVSILLV